MLEELSKWNYTTAGSLSHVAAQYDEAASMGRRWSSSRGVPARNCHASLGGSSAGASRDEEMRRRPLLASQLQADERVSRGCRSEEGRGGFLPVENVEAACVMMRFCDRVYIFISESFVLRIIAFLCFIIGITTSLVHWFVQWKKSGEVSYGTMEFTV